MAVGCSQGGRDGRGLWEVERKKGQEKRKDMAGYDCNGRNGKVRREEERKKGEVREDRTENG